MEKVVLRCGWQYKTRWKLFVKSLDTSLVHNCWRFRPSVNGCRLESCAGKVGWLRLALNILATIFQITFCISVPAFSFTFLCVANVHFYHQQNEFHASPVVIFAPLDVHAFWRSRFFLSGKYFEVSSLMVLQFRSESRLVWRSCGNGKRFLSDSVKTLNNCADIRRVLLYSSRFCSNGNLTRETSDD